MCSAWPWPVPSLDVRVATFRTLRGGGGAQSLTRSPTHGPRHLPCGTRPGSRTRVSGHKACRTVDSPQTPMVAWAGDTAVHVCVLGRDKGGRTKL